jgi:hypothetical protein
MGEVRRWFFGDVHRGLPSLWSRATQPFRSAYRATVELLTGERYLEALPGWLSHFFFATIFPLQFRDLPFHSHASHQHAHIATKKINTELEEARAKARLTRSEIETTEKLLGIDFGSDSCYYSLYKQCISVKKDEYNYELCPFERSSQSSTSLGNWDKWSDDSKKSMLYTGGMRCWNGPERLVKVDIACGVENKLEDAAEPARCEYAMKMTSPCACTQEELDSIEAVLKQYEQEEKDP